MREARQSAYRREDFDRDLAEIQGPVHAYVISLLGHGPDTEDVLQETNLFLCERWTEFEPGTSFKAWAFRVAYFKALACRRDRIRRDRVEFSEATLYRIAERAHQLYGEGEDRFRALQHCLGKLSENDRSILAVRYSKGHSLTNYARRHQKSVDAVHKTGSRLRLALKRCIDQQLHRP